MRPTTVSPAAAAVRLLTVDADNAGQRLDNFLMRHLKGVPKTHIYRIIRSGEVRINKGRCTADTRIAAGDVVRVPPVRMAAGAGAVAGCNNGTTHPHSAPGIPGTAPGHPPAREFAVLFEDEHFLAIDKPAGTAVHGGSGVSFGVIEQLRRARPGAKFLELVHRLDRETSGILLIAKKRQALLHLQDQFRGRETGKTYLALTLGAWPQQAGAASRTIDTPLRKYLLPDGERRVRTTTRDDADGMAALTLARPHGPQPALPARAHAGLPAMTLLEVTIKTGRTHQIRVHLASIGHPIAGDEKYGQFDTNKHLAKAGLKRMFLHAWRLRVRHPATGDTLTLHSPLPPDLRAILPHNSPDPGPTSSTAAHTTAPAH